MIDHMEYETAPLTENISYIFYIQNKRKENIIMLHVNWPQYVQRIQMNAILNLLFLSGRSITPCWSRAPHLGHLVVFSIGPLYRRFILTGTPSSFICHF